MTSQDVVCLDTNDFVKVYCLWIEIGDCSLVSLDTNKLLRSNASISLDTNKLLRSNASMSLDTNKLLRSSASEDDCLRSTVSGLVSTYGARFQLHQDTHATCTRLRPWGWVPARYIIAKLFIAGE